MYDILLKGVGHPDRARTVLSSLKVKDREFSQDSAKEKCIGFYLNFNENTALKDFEVSSFQWDVQREHKDSPTGGDFILFLTKQKGVNFLEATFYDTLFPIKKITSDDHGFYPSGQVSGE